MAYYIYENWQAGPHKAVIHNGSCGFCNEGQGQAGGYDPSHAKWHGPFATVESARFEQNRMPVKVKKECRCVKVKSIIMADNFQRSGSIS